MAEDQHRQDYPQQRSHEDSNSQAPSHHHQPTSRERHSTPNEAEVRNPRTTMAASVTLPSIHDPRSTSYGAPPPAASRGYSTDPRYASPNAVNGYPPPSGGHQQQPQGTYLPPLQPQADPRSSAYPPPEQRGGGYYDDRRPPPQGYHDQYPSDYYYRGPPQGPPPNGYPHDYRGPPPGPYGQEYGQPGGERPREAPRQRTSIACKYCRKRKIRCSGHQNAPGGKCQNCARMNQECVFQPVSSSSSTAFIPVSAVPGGVPPGTQLFGAYGQPLAPSAVPPHPYPPAGGPSHHPPPANYYHQPVQSPTDSYSSFGDPRGDEQVAGRRRRRTPEEQEEGYRLPPPRASGVPEDDPRRRSPAEFSNNSSPGGLGYSRYPGPPRHSPRNPTLPPPPGVGSSDGRSPVLQNGSSGASTPARPGPPTSQAQQSSSSVMSLSNLVDKNDIDKTMISRLNRPRDANTTPSSGTREGSR